MTTRIAAARAVVVVALVLTTAACGASGDDDEKGSSGRPSASEQSPKASSPETSASEDPFAPNVGDRALRVGDKRVGHSVTTTLHEVKLPYPPATYRVPDPGKVFLGLRVEQCLAEGVTDAVYSTTNIDWAAVTPSGNEFASDGSSWHDWPAPRFPEYVTLSPGRCVKGWIAFQVPKSTKVESLIWRPEGGVTAAEWKLQR
jgi:hypothetical protein